MNIKVLGGGCCKCENLLEAVKAAVVKIGSECAAQETEAESYASLCERLEEENSALVLENERLKKHGLKNVFTYFNGSYI